MLGLQSRCGHIVASFKGFHIVQAWTKNIGLPFLAREMGSVNTIMCPHVNLTLKTTKHEY